MTGDSWATRYPVHLATRPTPDQRHAARLALADRALRRHPGDQEAAARDLRQALDVLGLLAEETDQHLCGCGCGQPLSQTDRLAGRARRSRCRDRRGDAA